MGGCTFHEFLLHLGVVTALLRITAKWYVPIILAAIFFPCPVKATDDILGKIGPEAKHDAFVVNEELVKNFKQGGLLFIDGDFIGVALSEKPLSLKKGGSELSGSAVKLLPIDGVERTFDTELVTDPNAKQGSQNTRKKGSSLPLTLINAVLYFPYLFFNFSVIFFKLRNSS